MVRGRGKAHHHWAVGHLGEHIAQRAEGVSYKDVVIGVPRLVLEPVIKKPRFADHCRMGGRGDARVPASLTGCSLLLPRRIFEYAESYLCVLDVRLSVTSRGRAGFLTREEGIGNGGQAYRRFERAPTLPAASVGPWRGEQLRCEPSTCPRNPLAGPTCHTARRAHQNPNP